MLSPFKAPTNNSNDSDIVDFFSGIGHFFGLGDSVKFYTFYKLLTWEEAVQDCKARGMALAFPRDEDELEDFWDLIYSTNIGLHFWRGFWMGFKYDGKQWASFKINDNNRV